MMAIPEGEFPPHPTFDNKGLVIVGGGRCVWDDLESFCPHIRGGGYHLMAVNDVGMHVPLDLRHWFSNSGTELCNWVQCRRNGYNTNFATHSLKTHPRKVKYQWPFPGHGTSSLNAVYVGLRLGYDPIVLCGIPLDNSGHYFDPPWVETNFANEVPANNQTLKWWGNAAEKVFDGKVKSMSGRTRDLLGSP